MASSNSTSPPNFPSSFWIGQSLDWDAPWNPVQLYVELPFWLMVPDCLLNVTVNGCAFPVEVKGQYFELHAGTLHFDRQTCVHIGPPLSQDSQRQREIDASGVTVLPRKCRTVLRIHSRCNSDVLHVIADRQRNDAWLYLVALCSAHIAVVNALIAGYRQASYDQFAFEVSPRDVPIWYVDQSGTSNRVVLSDYSSWDVRPIEHLPDGTQQRVTFAQPMDVAVFLTYEPTPGELDLLDAQHLMERGDYSGAVRRIVTAIEAVLESQLRYELSQRYSAQQVDNQLRATEQKFNQRLQEYETESGRVLDSALHDQLERTRILRHTIVHRGNRLDYSQRGEAQQSVDTGRWIFDWIEDRPHRANVRNNQLAVKGLARHFPLFHARIEPDGVTVQGRG